jgi:hypothetical protein
MERNEGLAAVPPKAAEGATAALGQLLPFPACANLICKILAMKRSTKSPAQKLRVW